MSNPYQQPPYPQPGPTGAPQGAYQAPYGQPPYGFAPQPGNGMAVAALVLSIIGVIICWLWGIGGFLGLLAIIFAAAGLKRANRGASGKGMAVAGLTLGIIALIAGGIFLTTEVIIVKKANDCVNSQTIEQAQQNCSDFTN